MFEWDYQKGNLDEATKKYAVGAAKAAKERGGLIHFFWRGQLAWYWNSRTWIG